LESKGILTKDQYKEMQKDVQTELREIYDSMKEQDATEFEAEDMPKALSNGLDQFETAVPLEKLKKLNAELMDRPEGFQGFKRIEKILKRRENVLEEGQKDDWGAGEALTYASILNDGIPIRLTGQDTERGTFAHRHSVLHDVNTGKRYIPFHGLKDAQASFDVRNSPLSEAGVLGFEYGYSVQ